MAMAAVFLPEQTFLINSLAIKPYRSIHLSNKNVMREEWWRKFSFFWLSALLVIIFSLFPVVNCEM